MCGRYSHKFKWKEIHALLTQGRWPARWADQQQELQARFNVAPTQDAPVVRLSTDGLLHGDMLRWGLVPFWSKEIGPPLVNARAESVAGKPAFRAAFHQRRCLVPVSGFYEWQKLEGGAKQPVYTVSADEKPLLLAGLWERWQPQGGGETLESFVIITTEPNELTGKVHDRMPAILAPEQCEQWLDPKTPPEQVAALLRPYPAELLMAYPVNRRVGSPRNDGPECIEPLAGGEQTELF